MEYAVYRDDVKHIILDNLQARHYAWHLLFPPFYEQYGTALHTTYCPWPSLNPTFPLEQFMLPQSVNSGNFDKFTMQDAVIERFRRFATEKLVQE